jgi:RNA polymerase sigma-70 factor (ECF subfamily)
MPAAISMPHAEAVLSTLQRCRVPACELEDAAQDVFVIMLRRWPRGEQAPRAWLLAIARNVARNRRKSDRRRPGHDELRDEDAVAGTSPETSYFEAERRAAIDDSIDALPEDVRETFVLREIDGLSMEEIAAVQGVPLSTVQSRLRRARPLFYKETDRRKAAGVLAAFALGLPESEPAIPQWAGARRLFELLGVSFISAGVGAAVTFALMRDRPPSVPVEPDRAVLVSHAQPVPVTVPSEPPPLTAPAPSSPPAPADADPSIDTELILLERASADINAGNDAAALQLLKRYQKLFPNGAFASTCDKLLRQVGQKRTNPKPGL